MSDNVTDDDTQSAVGERNVIIEITPDLFGRLVIVKEFVTRYRWSMPQHHR